MRRFTILIAFSLCMTSLYAQNNAERVRLLGAKCDSIGKALADMRYKYSQSETLRTELTPKIIVAEQELRACKSQYDAAVLALSKEEAAATLKGLSALQQVATEIAKAEQSKPSRSAQPNTKKNLVSNPFFATKLSREEQKTLQDAQQLEGEANALATSYTTHYSELLSLQRNYMEVDSPRKADSVAVLFNVKLGEIRELDERLSKTLSTLYINKSYIYDLLMEREGHSAMLTLSASLSASAEREIEKYSDTYISDALMRYILRKRGLVEYELKLAELLSADKACDSLKAVANVLKQRDFKLSPITLQRRNFIEYEPISIKGTSFYNSKNPIPRTKIYDYGTVYRIRIGLFRNRPNISALRGVAPLSYTDAYNKGLYAYFVGGFRTEQEANKGVAQLQKLGFKEPIIAVWVDGEFYPTLDAMQKKLGQYNVEISGIETLSEDIKAKIAQRSTELTISRVGSTFIVGTFNSKGDAEALVSDLKALNGDITAEIAQKR